MRQNRPINQGELENVLLGMDYPADKGKLVLQAKDHRADKDVINYIESLPDRDYTSTADVATGSKVVY